MNPAAQPFKIETSESAAGACVLKLSGPLTLQTLANMQSAAQQETDKPLILDLGGVAYMDSAGLGSVISVFTACQRTQRKFAITGLTERIQKLFQLTRVNSILPCHETMAEAEASVAT